MSWGGGAIGVRVEIATAYAVEFTGEPTLQVVTIGGDAAIGQGAAKNGIGGGAVDVGLQGVEVVFRGDEAAG